MTRIFWPWLHQKHLPPGPTQSSVRRRHLEDYSLISMRWSTSDWKCCVSLNLILATYDDRRYIQTVLQLADSTIFDSCCVQIALAQLRRAGWSTQSSTSPIPCFPAPTTVVRSNTIVGRWALVEAVQIVSAGRWCLRHIWYYYHPGCTFS